MVQPIFPVLWVRHVRVAAASHGRFAGLFLVALIAAPADAGVILDSALSTYQDAEKKTLSISSEAQTDTNFSSDQGYSTTLTLGATRKTIDYDANAINNQHVVFQQLGGATELTQNSMSIGVDQGLGVGTNIGAFTGASFSRLGASRFWGGRIGQWWQKETFQTVVEVRKTTAEQGADEVYGDDKRVVRLPENIEGKNFSLSLLWMTTPDLILRSSFSLTKRTDRPDAQSVTGEARYMIAATQSAVHFGLSHFENVGEVERVSLYGSVVANSAKGEWHQRLWEHLILMGGYRYYDEHEKPFYDESARKSLRSDWSYASLRWRFDDGLWTQDCPEVYLFGGHYHSSEPRTGNLVGAGTKLIF